jgi:hypothetical protein
MDTERAFITAEIRGWSVRLPKHQFNPPMIRRQVEEFFERDIGDSKQ